MACAELGIDPSGWSQVELHTVIAERIAAEAAIHTPKAPGTKEANGGDIETDHPFEFSTAPHALSAPWAASISVPCGARWFGPRPAGDRTEVGTN